MKDNYEVFLENIDSWVNNVFISIPFDKEKVECILAKDIDLLKSESQEILYSDCVLLYRYIDFLQSVYNKEKSILDFAEQSILYLSSKNIENSGDKYTKWELKYNEGIKKDPLSVKLLKLAVSSRAKVSIAEKRIDNVKKIADLIYQIANSKKYERN